MTYSLLPHQIDLVERTRRAMAEGKRRPLICLPTGGGKTMVFCLGMVRPAYERGKRVWIIVPKKALVDQTSGKLTELGVDHGVLQSKHYKTNYSKRVQVISKETLARRIDKIEFAAPDLIVWDEAHHMTDDNGFGDIAKRYESIPQVGVTATPCRLDGKGMGRFFDELIIGPTVNEMIALRILIPMRVYTRPVDLSGIGINSATKDYKQGELGKRMGTAAVVGDMVLEYSKRAAGRRAIGFATTVENAKQYVETFAAAGIPSASITQDTPDAERKKHIADLADGTIKVLWSVGVFTEGFDLPCVECIIAARPSKSLQLVIQMLGRGIRAADGPGNARDGEHCVLLDHAGLTHEHGFVTDERDWSLEDGIVARKNGKPREAYTCPHCEVELHGWPLMCPACGESLRPDQAEQQRLPIDTGVELVEVSPDESAKARIEEMKEYYRQAEDQAYLMNEEAWKPGWRFKKRFGEYPPPTVRRGSRIRLVKDVEGKWKPEWKHDGTLSEGMHL